MRGCPKDRDKLPPAFKLLAYPLLSLPALIAIGFGLRLIWALLIPVDPLSDPAAYLTMATNLQLYGVYGFLPDEPSANWPVGTSAIYAGVFVIFGTGSQVGIVTINLISSLLILWGIFDLGRRWFGELEGRLAAGLFAIWPLAIQYTTIVASELHFMAFCVLALCFWNRVSRSPSGIAALLLSGVFFAAATYVRPIALLVPTVLALAHLLRAPRSAPATILKAMVVTALIFAFVAPWSARNERVFGEPVFMSTNFGTNLWIGNHPGATGVYVPLPPETATMGLIEREDYLRERAIAYIRQDPAGFVVRTMRKALTLHDRETIGVAWNARQLQALVGTGGMTALKIVSTGYWYGVLIGAFAGCVVLLRQQGWRATLFSPYIWLWLYFTAVHAVILVSDRMHMPAIPMIALLASVALAALLQRCGQYKQSA